MIGVALAATMLIKGPYAGKKESRDTGFNQQYENKRKQIVIKGDGGLTFGADPIVNDIDLNAQYRHAVQESPALAGTMPIKEIMLVKKHYSKITE